MSKKKPNVRPTLRVTTDERFTLTVRKNKRRKLYYAVLSRAFDGAAGQSKGGFKSPAEAEAWGRAISALEGPVRNPWATVTSWQDHHADAYRYAMQFGTALGGTIT